MEYVKEKRRNSGSLLQFIRAAMTAQNNAAMAWVLVMFITASSETQKPQAANRFERHLCCYRQMKFRLRED